MANQAFLSQLPGHIPILQEDRGTVLQATSTEDVLAIMQLANQTQARVCPADACLLHPLDVIWLDLSQMNRIRRYRHDELLLTLETGTTIGQLSEALTFQHQRFPYLYRKSRTLLSLLAEETLSLSETRTSPLRYAVVGIEAVTGDGKWIHYGGEVVKNVTGYDLSKLFIGSRHRYGILTAVTLKTDAKPEASRSFLFHVEELDQALELLHRLDRLLIGHEILTLFKTKTSFGWQILLSLSGYKETVYQESDAVHEATGHLNTDLQELYLAPKALEQWIQRLDWTSPEEPDALVLQIALPHKAMMDLPYRFYQHSWLKSADVMLPLRSNRMLLRWISVNMPTPEELLSLKAQIVELGGLVEIVRIPPSFSSLDLDAFQAVSQPALKALGDRLKHQFDPNGVLPDGLLYVKNLSPAEITPR